MDDMTNDSGRSADTTPEPLMPLSMPPVHDQSSTPPDLPTAVDLPPAIDSPTREFVPLMPLSMPSGAHGVTPPPPPGPTGWEPWDLPPHRPSSRRRLLAVVVAVALVAAGGGAALGSVLSSSNNANPSISTTPAASLPTGKSSTLVTTVAAQVIPAVVDIETTVATQTGSTTEEEAGTGMIVTSSGEVLTNNHVIDDATSIRVVIHGRSGTFKASVVGVDPPEHSDVALLQIQGVSGLPHVRFANSTEVKVGEPVIGIGNALGLEGTPSVVSGIVSALGRTINASDDSGSTTETLRNLIETDAPIVPGDSGGPLVNSSAEVIGMDTAASSVEDSNTTVGFAIPINAARTIVDNIQHGKTTNGVILGESAYLGVYKEASTGTGSNFGLGTGNNGNTGNTGTTASGVTIAGVAANSPASWAGLVTGDVITSLAGTTITTWSKLTSVVDSHHPGSLVSMSYTDTTGVPHTVAVTFGGIPK